MNKIPYYTEVALAVVALLGFVLKIKSIAVGEVLLPLGLIGLGLFYVAHIFLPAQWQAYPSPSKFNFLSILTYLVSGFAAVGLLMKLSLMPYAADVLRYVLAAFVGALIFVLFQYRVAQSPAWILHYRHLLSRTVLIASTCFLFYITPYKKIAKLYYPQNPDYVEALDKYLKEPENKNLQKEVEELRPK